MESTSYNFMEQNIILLNKKCILISIKEIKATVESLNINLAYLRLENKIME